ncbi:putative ribokinase KNAG_0C00840 [Huiozyma naganishii CBS 8797]|uniref:Ribokinase n=1 Tax=Huiozyma naganishii (strain ATCC MYA-139 / BCRC 22969 / CBS 8797 / KCTC 17520 / NBRC 10181 / NCYC 3082 / Yp74L-3) TaxID=1071383 RepID=J7RW43_HUIN7|nr:hypothetical protein KNAG_0C00840 [Kazachstania naganishii CBS 8797]CCK69197.1 hypothetical protein KNAG_0C00840 [Kazachstania naganishii CBS 8797]
MSISVVGSLNYDLVTYTERVPDAGETFRANYFETHVGGKGLNQAVALRKLKDSSVPYGIRMVGNVGTDSFGDALLGLLQSHDIDVSHVRKSEGVRTGVATILVENSTGQNRILITEGANGKTVYGSKELETIFPETEDRNMVVFQQETPDPCSVMRWLKKNRPDHQIVFNPSPFKAVDKEDWQLVDVLIVNEIESLQIVQTVFPRDEVKKYEAEIEKDFMKGYNAVCKILQEQCVSEKGPAIVIITLGSKGALYCSNENKEIKFLPAAANVHVVDTTAAGDTFLGAFTTQFYQGANINEAIKFSTRASSVTIQRKGAAESIPMYDEIVNK